MSRPQIDGWMKRLAADTEMVQQTEKALAELAAVEDELILPGEKKNAFSVIQSDRLNAALAMIISIVASADAAPTVQAVQLTDQHASAIDEQLRRVDEIIVKDIASLNGLIEKSGAPPIGE